MKTAPEQDRALVWLATTLLISVLLSICISAVLIATGEPSTTAVKAPAPAQVAYLLTPTGSDSWVPMANAYRRKIKDPRSDLYAIFFTDRVKFQYPPSSLLIFDLFPRSVRPVDGVLSRPLRRWLDWSSRGAVVMTVLASAVILDVGLRPLPSNRPTRPARIVLSVALGLTFYPLLTGHILGQIQVFLNGLIALAMFFYLVGWRGLAGACFGACCLLKPHYGLVMLWSLLRRQWQFTVGLAGVLLSGLALSVARFGLDDHLQYLAVVRELSRVGEAFWFNQSVNGLLNRLLENGSALGRRGLPTEFPPYHPVVYALTVVSSVAILAFALWPRSGKHRADGGPIDLMVMLVAATIASPIAWYHHYGAFLPIFAAALPGLIHVRPLGRITAPLFALSYAAIANLLVVQPQAFFGNPGVGLAGSHVFLGGLIFFALLIALRTVMPPVAMPVKG